MARDKIIQSGQFTFSRLLFLAICGGLIAASVWGGGIWLTIGYWAISLGLCVLLFLIAIDYGVKMDKVEFKSQTMQPVANIDTFVPPASESVSGPRIKRQTKRPAKRRR